MTTAIILDTEGTSRENPDVIQLAYTDQLHSPRAMAENVTCLMFKPTKPMELGALATHHIIEDDLVDCETWPGSWSPPAGVEYLVGHGIDYDWKAIGQPNVKRICTLALAKRAWPKLDSHKLTALIYHLYLPKIARELTQHAHNASTDIDLCAKVLYAVQDAFNRPETWHDLWLKSEDARVPTHMTFGKKYSPKEFPPLGMPIPEMRRRDPGYCKWLLNNADIVLNDPYWQKALLQ